MLSFSPNLLALCYTCRSYFSQKSTITMDDQSLVSADIYFDYEPTIECILNHVEEGEQPSSPSRSKKSTVLTESTNSVEVHSNEDWVKLNRRPRRRKFILFALLLFCFVFATIMSVTVGILAWRKKMESNVTNDFPVSPSPPSVLVPIDNVLTGQTQSPTAPNSSSTTQAPSFSPQQSTFLPTVPPTTSAPTQPPSRGGTPPPTRKATALPTKPATASPTNSPTMSPTKSPSTESPTKAASSAPTKDDCSSFIWSESSCYKPEINMHIFFENCNPFGDDWIGIYQVDPQADLNDLGDPLLWMWTCGSQNCRGEVFMDTLIFGGGLQEGRYVAHLIRRNSGGPYASYAASPSFQVDGDCS